MKNKLLLYDLNSINSEIIYKSWSKIKYILKKEFILFKYTFIKKTIS